MHATLRRSALSLVLALAVATTASAEEGLVFVDAAAGLPIAAPLEYDTREESLCAEDLRAPQTDGERALLGRGWVLTAAAVVRGNTRAVLASAGLGGQCRPMDNRVFLFDQDRYLGHVRSSDMQGWPSVKLDTARLVRISESYRKPEDAKCCPSGTSELELEIVSDGILIVR